MRAFAALASAHSGPPYPIVSNRIIGAYQVSVWTDPDATDDGSAAGRFWVVLDAATKAPGIPPETRVSLTIRPTDRQDLLITASAEPEARDTSRRFAVFVMDHEGHYDVQVAIDGPLGPASLDEGVDATYDLRPQPALSRSF
jgi:hypothetical protein